MLTERVKEWTRTWREEGLKQGLERGREQGRGREMGNGDILVFLQALPHATFGWGCFSCGQLSPRPLPAAARPSRLVTWKRHVARMSHRSGRSAHRLDAVPKYRYQAVGLTEAAHLGPEILQ